MPNAAAATAHLISPPPVQPAVRPTSQAGAPRDARNSPLPHIDRARAGRIAAAASSTGQLDTVLKAELILQLARKNPRAVDPRYFAIGMDESERQAMEAHALARSALVAKAFAGQFHEVKRTWTSCAPWAALPAGTTAATVLREIFTHNPAAPGAVVGECHADSAPKRLLIDHVRELVGLGVDTLYLEHIPGDALQHELDACSRGESASEALRDHLSWLDWGHRTTKGGGYTDLVNECATFNANATAKADRRLRLVALDTTASYFLKGVTGPNGSPPRIKVFNLQAQETIDEDRQANPSSGRWLALVGNSHIGRWKGDPGLGQRLGVPTLRVTARSAQPAGVGFDPGAPAHEGLTGAMEGLVKGDYLLNVADGAAEASTAIRRAYGRLQQPGDFLVEGDILFYRHIDWKLVHRPIKPSPDGSICIAPLPLNDMPTAFRNVEALRSALDRHVRDARLNASGAGPGTYYLGKDDEGHVLTHKSRAGLLVQTRIVSAESGYRLVITDAHSVNFKAFKGQEFSDLECLAAALANVLPHPCPTADLTLDTSRL